jgi:hypothetical protein
LTLNRKIFAIAYLPAVQLEPFGREHVAQIQNLESKTCPVSATEGIAVVKGRHLTPSIS